MDHSEIQDMGASAVPTGLSPTVEPVPVSPPDGASIPSADEIDGWLMTQCAEIGRFTEWYILGGFDLDGPNYRMKLGEHIGFMRLRSFISGARKAAQAIEARRATTGTGSVHESAVLKGCAQKAPENQS